jgi:hypothetical protein
VYDSLRAAFAQKALAYCRSPEFRRATCGWASDDEYNKILGNAYSGRYRSGSLYGNKLDQLPDEMGASNMFWFGWQVVSLACKGPLVSRMVYQVRDDTRIGTALSLGGSRASDTLGTIGVNAQNRIRCDLVLPSGTSGPEGAVRAREVNCRTCETLTKPGCELVKGKWYSDTVAFESRGCAGLASGKYLPITPFVLSNPDSNYLLAKFEVQPRGEWTPTFGHH